MMQDRRGNDERVEEACARLREALTQTHGLGRREFLRALARTAAGSALLAPFDDAAAFVAEARRMVQDMGFARSLGAAARSAAQSLTWDRIVLDFEHVLADVAH